MMNSENSFIKKENCPGCQVSILCHHKIMLCDNCDTIHHASHAGCSQSSFRYDYVRNIWLCIDCVVTIPVMYNPFYVLSYDRHGPKIECNDEIESEKMNLLSLLVNKKAIAKKTYSRLFSAI